MSLTGHIIKKDLRQIWPHVLLWTAVAAVLYIWGRASTVPMRGGHGFTGFDLCFAGYCLLWFSLFPAILGTDPAVGTSEFWMTRPVAGKILFYAKLIEAVFVGVVLALLLHGIFLFGQGFSPSQVGTALIHLLPRLGLFAAIGVFVSSQTRGILQFWFLFLGLAGGLFLVTHLQNAVPPSVAPEGVFAMGWVAAVGILTGVGSIAVAALQYRYRSRRTCILAATAFALPIIGFFFFWNEPRQPDISAPLERIAWEVQREPWPLPGYSVEKLGFFDLRFAPRAGEIIRISRASGRLVWSDQSFGYEHKVLGQLMVGMYGAVRAALGAGYTLILDPNAVEDRLSLPLHARSGEEVHLLKFEGQLEGESISMTRIGVIPLAKGSSATQDGHKFEIRDVSLASRRYFDVKGLYQCPHYRKKEAGRLLEPLVVLVNEAKQEARILSTNRYFGSFDSRIPGLDVMYLWWSVAEEWNEKKQPSSINSSWIEEAKLYVFELTLRKPIAVPVDCGLTDAAPSAAGP